MKNSAYTNGVLTLIALSLLVIATHDLGLIPEASAQASPGEQKVVITGWQFDPNDHDLPVVIMNDSHNAVPIKTK